MDNPIEEVAKENVEAVEKTESEESEGQGE